MTSKAVDSAPQKGSNQDEHLMEQSLVFLDTLKEMKNLRKQLYSAAEFFEMSYRKQNQKELVMETIKEYAVKAMINTVDHLGSVAFKVNNLLDEKLGEFSEMELGLTCLEQRVKSCQGFANNGGISQQSLAMKTPSYHKRYVFTDKEMKDGFWQKTLNENRRISANPEEEEEENDDSNRFKTGYLSTIMESPALYLREVHSSSRSPVPTLRRGPFYFTRILRHQQTERAASPNLFPILRSGSNLKRSPSPNYSHAKRRYPSDPRRSVSLSTHAERNRSIDEQYTSKSKRLFKALTSMRKSKKDTILYKFLDEN